MIYVSSLTPAKDDHTYLKNMFPENVSWFMHEGVFLYWTKPTSV